jgi:tetratricopeptide (TPR) repeat protein
MPEPIITALLTKIGASALISAGKGGYAKLTKVSAFSSSVKATAERFPHLEVELALKRWSERPAFRAIVSALEKGERPPAEAEVVTAFIEQGEFFCGDSTAQQAKEVLSEFLGELENQIYGSGSGLAAVAARQEVLHAETRDITLKTANTVLQKLENVESLLTAPGKPDTKITWEKVYEDRVEVARKLLDAGKPRTAQRLLTELRTQVASQDPSRSLLYRIATNLGACAFRLDDHESAIQEIDFALRLDPENPKAITNAAVNNLILGKPAQALTLILKARGKAPNDSHAAANHIQALFALDREPEVNALLEAEAWIADDSHCCFTLGVMLFNKGRFTEAQKYLRQAYAKEPENPEILLNLGHAVMRPTQQHLLGQPILRWQFPPEYVSALTEAQDLLTRALTLMQDFESHKPVAFAHILRADARRMLSDLVGSISDCDQALADNPTDVDALQIKGLALFDDDRFAESISCFEKISESGQLLQILVPLTMAYNATGRHDEAIRILDERWKQIAPESLERVRIADGLLWAYSETKQHQKADEVITALKTARPNDPEAMAAIGRYLRKQGKERDALSVLTEAVAYAAGPVKNMISLELADIYYRQRKFGNAAEFYEAVVDRSGPNDLAVRYVICLFNSGAHKEALRVSQNLRKPGEAVPIISQIEAMVLAETGDLVSAQKILEKLNHLEPENYSLRIQSAELAVRRLNEMRARELLSEVSLEKVRNDPYALARIAQLRARLKTGEVLKYAYQARRAGYSIPQIHGIYVNLFVSREQVDQVDLTKEVVDEDSAVLLENGPQQIAYIITADSDVHPEQGEISLEQAKSMNLLGRKKDDLVPIRPNAFGPTPEYKIIEVQSKYVRAFQETLQKFPTLFPTDTTLQGVSGPYETFREQLFKQLDQEQERMAKLESVYRSRSITLEALARLAHRSLLELWGGLTSGQYFPLLASTGDPVEMKQECEALDSTHKLLLDLTSVLTLAQLGALDPLAQGFELLTTQPVLDAVNEAYSSLSMSKPSLNVGKQGAQYVKEEITAERIATNLKFLEKICSFLAEKVKTIPVPLLLDRQAIKPDLRDFLGPMSTASLLASREHDLVLISEDMMLRALAQNEWNVPGAWSQPVLNHLRSKKIITDAAYAEAVAVLAVMNYRFVSVNADAVLWLLGRANYKVTNEVRRILSIFQGPECTLESAIEILAEVTKKVWLENTLFHYKIEFLDAALENLIMGRPTNQVTDLFTLALQIKLMLVPKAFETIERRIKTWKQQSLGRLGLLRTD